MSNITRYTCVANDHDAMVSNPDGEYVRFDYANSHVEMLEKRIEELENALTEIAKLPDARRDEGQYIACRALGVS